MQELIKMNPEEKQNYYRRAAEAARYIYGSPTKKEKSYIPKAKLKKQESCRSWSQLQ
jgi:hypothetical protein